jgi:hypothetical protein
MKNQEKTRVWNPVMGQNKDMAKRSPKIEQKSKLKNHYKLLEYMINP